jgi:hypothetical protein
MAFFSSRNRTSILSYLVALVYLDLWSNRTRNGGQLLSSGYAEKETITLNPDTQALLMTLLILLIALLQFLLHGKPQSAQVKELEDRLAEVEQRLESLQQLVKF